MVVKLEGKINGEDVIFANKGDTWETIIPPNLQGRYIVELTAIDEAGNVAYATRALFTFNSNSLLTTVEFNDYWLEQSEPDFITTYKNSDFDVTVACC